MSLFNSADKELQAAAFKAGLRTFEQTTEAGLGVGVVGGVVVGSTGALGNAFTINYMALLGGVLFVLLAAFFAGLKSFLSISSNGLPTQYTAAAGSSAAVTAAVSTLTAAGVSTVTNNVSDSSPSMSTPEPTTASSVASTWPDTIPLTAASAASEPA